MSTQFSPARQRHVAHIGIFKCSAESKDIDVCCDWPIWSYTVGTVPFPNARQRATHFAKHGSDFGAANEFDYERMADAFMSAPMHPSLHECTRPIGTHDRIRLDATTRHFGVAFNILTIRTYHIRSAHSIALRGGPAGFIAYECAKVN